MPIVQRMGSWSPGDFSCIIIFYNIIFSRHREMDYMADDLDSWKTLFSL